MQRFKSTSIRLDLHELVDEGIIGLPSDTLVSQTDVVLIIKQLLSVDKKMCEEMKVFPQNFRNLPVSADIEGDRQSLARRYAGYGCVQSKLAHRDAHALGVRRRRTASIRSIWSESRSLRYLSSQVPQPQDPLSVSDHDTPHVTLRPVLEHVVHVAGVVDRDEQTLRYVGKIKFSLNVRCFISIPEAS